jgi:aspartyl protease family protein
MAPPATPIKTACPRCGAESTLSPEEWIGEIDGDGPPVCGRCGHLPDQSHRRDSPGETGPVGRRSAWVFWLTLLLLAGLFLILNRVFDVLAVSEDGGQIAYIAAFILIVSASLATGRLGPKLKHLAIWFCIFAAALVGYSFRHELARIPASVLGELIPSRGIQHQPRTIRFPASADGHFYIRAEVNGVALTFLADTGASHIVLSPRDARKLGIDPETLAFNRLYETANGRVRASSLRIDELRVGDIRLAGIVASINEAAMRHSLLGMTFFRRLARYEVSDGVLTLTARQ